MHHYPPNMIFLSDITTVIPLANCKRAVSLIFNKKLAVKTLKKKQTVYLFYAALGGAEHVDDVARDQHHRRQRHEPANDLAPHWVHVLPQGQRRHLDGTERKDPL